MNGLKSSLARITRSARFSTCATRYATTRDRDRVQRERDRVQHDPNPTMEDDPSLMLLLRDVDTAVKGTKGREMRQQKPIDQYPFYNRVKVAEFDEVAPEDETYSDFIENEDDHFEGERKALAAVMGGIKARSVSLPIPLVVQMEEIIDEADKRQLRSDAKRMYERASSEDSAAWQMQDAEYKNRRQELDRSHRDGLAYAAVFLPQHYASIYNVLRQMDLRFGLDLKVTNILDMGCHSGAALWAARTVFSEDDQCRVKNYFGVDPRPKMVQMGERLIKDIDLYGCTASFHYKLKDAFPDGLTPEAAAETIVLSAFDLSRHARWRDRRDRLHTMWQTGAETIVLIESGDRKGYEFIAEAREYLLRLGALEVHESKYAVSDEERPFWTPGAHVAMPCPHDRPCAVLPAVKFTCSFGQTFDPPAFSRDTKHTHSGYLDSAKHSYVVFRRGLRPEAPGTSLGRIGLIGRKEQLKTAHVKELQEEGEGDKKVLVLRQDLQEPQMDDDELKAALRKEAMFWPRLNMPPLKKPGHIVMDACIQDGTIQRLTISRSRGKQEYYDARKSSWGDSFPHEPTIPPVLRFKALRRLEHFDPDESVLAVLELAERQKRKRAEGSGNKWNRDKSRVDRHEERRKARKDALRA